MERKLTIAAACIAAIIAILMPAGYFAVGYQSEATVLATGLDVFLIHSARSLGAWGLLLILALRRK